VQPKVYTIAPERPFLATLADGLLGMTGEDPLQLTHLTILLPTRRAMRALRDAFLRATPEGHEAGTHLLLPRMRLICALDSDELSIARNGGRRRTGGRAQDSVPPPVLASTVR
jgi:ATP-dependent helicase/nuclease subunit B